MRITLYALVMAFGALVASIGLVLLFRKNEQQSLSKIKIFGQEFQFSAPGLVVALAGCALVVLFPVLGIHDKDVITFGSPSPPPTQGPNPGSNEMRVGNGIYRLISSDVVPYSSDTKQVTVVIRYTATDDDALFGNDKIRLRVENRMFSPSFNIDSYVAAHSDSEMKFVFYVPSSAKAARLQMGLIGDNVPEIPIDLAVSEH